MRQTDEFDDPQKAGAIAAIFRTLDVRRHIAARGPLFPALLLLGMVAVLAAVLWYSYPREAEKQALRAVPIIRADAGPYRIVPDDPGGMDIPYRDSTVFDTLREAQQRTGGENNSNRIENLLPEAEKPMPREEMFAGLKADPPEIIQEQQVTAEPESQADAAVEPIEITERQPMEPAAVAPAMAESEKEELEQKVAEVSSAPKPVAKPRYQPEAESAARTEPAAGIDRMTRDAPPEPGSVYIQLGSLKSMEAAETAWKDLQRSFPSQLGELKLHVQQADLGGRGVFYRVQAGPLASGKAQSVCETILAERPGGCLVVRN